MLLACAGFAAPALADVTVTDILDRQVTIPQTATRIVLGEGRHLSVLGLIHDDPVSLIAGWRTERGLDKPTMDAYRARFPAIDDIRTIGGGARGISAESVIALDPDLLVMSLMDVNDPAMQRASQQIEAAGIPIVYVDFFSHPQENSIPSLRILGRLTGAGDRAEEFAQFYESHLDTIRDRLADSTIMRPRVFVHVHAAPQNCCATVGQGVFHDFVTTAGGENIAAALSSSVQANVSLEYLIGADPDYYIATGGAHMEARGGLVLGAGIGPDQAKGSFQSLLDAPGFETLTAVRNGHAAGIWHMFNDSPVHIALIEYLAKTFHPDLFADVDPAATLNEIETRFSPVTVDGTWWIDNQP